MPGARQPLYPPYAEGTNYRIVNTNNPDTNILVRYIGPNPLSPNEHRFQRLEGEAGILTPEASNPPEGLYVTGVGNAGGRRKSRSRKSKRKIRRTHRKSRRHH